MIVRKEGVYYFKRDMFNGRPVLGAKPVKIKRIYPGIVYPVIGDHPEAMYCSFTLQGKYFEDGDHEFDLIEYDPKPFKSLYNVLEPGWLVKTEANKCVEVEMLVRFNLTRNKVFVFGWWVGGDWLLENCELSKDGGKTWGVCGETVK